MKKLLAIFLLASIATACNNDPKGTVQSTEAKEVPTTSGAVNYQLDTARSRVFWEGNEGLAMIRTSHKGFFRLNSGNLSVQNGALTGGAFEISTASFTDIDIPDPATRTKFEGHIRDANFLGSTEFPTARFEWTGSEKMSADSVKITGNLVLKNVRKSITFPAKVIIRDNTVQADAKFSINRKDWGIHYRSENSLGDDLVRPEVGIQLQIVASKQ